MYHENKKAKKGVLTLRLLPDFSFWKCQKPSCINIAKYQFYENGSRARVNSKYPNFQS